MGDHTAPHGLSMRHICTSSFCLEVRFKPSTVPDVNNFNPAAIWEQRVINPVLFV